MWPRVTRSLPTMKNQGEWTAHPQCYNEWQEAVELRDTYGPELKPKGSVTCRRYAPSVPPTHLRFRRPLALARAVVEITNYETNDSKVRSIERKMDVLKIGHLKNLDR